MIFIPQDRDIVVGTVENELVWADRLSLMGFPAVMEFGVVPLEGVSRLSLTSDPPRSFRHGADERSTILLIRAWLHWWKRQLKGVFPHSVFTSCVCHPSNSERIIELKLHWSGGPSRRKVEEFVKEIAPANVSWRVQLARVPLDDEMEELVRSIAQSWKIQPPTLEILEADLTLMFPMWFRGLPFNETRLDGALFSWLDDRADSESEELPEFTRPSSADVMEWCMSGAVEARTFGMFATGCLSSANGADNF